MAEQKIPETLHTIQNSFDNLDATEQVKLLEEITCIMAYFKSENDNNDATDGIFNALSEIAESVQEDFEELVGISNDKKAFVRALARIFTLLLNTNIDTIDKIKKLIKLAIETMLKIWQEPRQR